MSIFTKNRLISAKKTQKTRQPPLLLPAIRILPIYSGRAPVILYVSSLRPPPTSTASAPSLTRPPLLLPPQIFYIQYDYYYSAIKARWLYRFILAHELTQYPKSHSFRPFWYIYN